MSVRALALIGGSVLVAGVAVAETPELVEQALVALEQSDERDWAYTETTVAEGTTLVERFDPSLPEERQRTLLLVNGRPPTDEERAKYFEEQNKENDASGDGSDGESEEDEVRAMIRPGSLDLLDETPTHATYRFEPEADNDEDAEIFKHLDATLRIVKQGPYVETIELRSPAPFKPSFGVKLKEFVMVMSFDPVGEQKIVLPSSFNMHVAGRAMLVKKFDETVEVRYSDYRYVGDLGETP